MKKLLALSLAAIMVLSLAGCESSGRSIIDSLANAESIERAASIETTQSVETTEATENVESTETTENVESTETTENVETTEATQSTTAPTAESTEPSEETVETTEAVTEPETTATEINIGDTFTFGTYEQDNNAENGAEAIEWVVLTVDSDKALVLSRYCLDCEPYNTEEVSVTWENCTLRSWLNNEFLNSAFSEAEQSAILPTTLSNSADDGYYETYGGNDTTDTVFLLSYREYKDYCEDSGYKRASLTLYCESNGGWNGVNSKTNWWLRSPGSTNDTASYIGYYGISSRNVTGGNMQLVSVRPAMWVSISAGILG